MIPIHDLLSRIRWDAAFARSRFVIGYWDRVAGRVLHAACARSPGTPTTRPSST